MIIKMKKPGKNMLTSLSIAAVTFSFKSLRLKKITFKFKHYQNILKNYTKYE